MASCIDNIDNKDFISNEKIDDSVHVIEETTKLLFGE
jgi:hypothetical protein